MRELDRLALVLLSRSLLRPNNYFSNATITQKVNLPSTVQQRKVRGEFLVAWKTRATPAIAGSLSSGLVKDLPLYACTCLYHRDKSRKWPKIGVSNLSEALSAGVDVQILLCLEKFSELPGCCSEASHSVHSHDTSYCPKWRMRLERRRS